MMNIRFWQILRNLFILINRLSLIQKVIYGFVFVVLANAIFSIISNIFKNLTNYIFQNYQTILAICGILLFGAGCFLYFVRWKSKQRLSDEALDTPYLLEENSENQSLSIYTEGNYNENVHGDYVEIHGNYININNDFSEVAAQIRELVTQLTNQGYTQEDAETEIASELEEQALNNPKLEKTFYRWRKYFSKKNNIASDNEIAKDIVTTSTSYNYFSSKDFTEVIAGDFHTLNELLQSRKWEQADLQTKKIIYEISQNELPDSNYYKRCPPNYIVQEHIKVIPKKYLNNIDKLWRKYSNGRFGFSVQKKIVNVFVSKNKYIVFIVLNNMVLVNLAI